MKCKAINKQRFYIFRENNSFALKESHSSEPIAVRKVPDFSDITGFKGHFVPVYVYMPDDNLIPHAGPGAVYIYTIDGERIEKDAKGRTILEFDYISPHGYFANQSNYFIGYQDDATYLFDQDLYKIESGRYIYEDGLVKGESEYLIVVTDQEIPSEIESVKRIIQPSKNPHSISEWCSLEHLDISTHGLVKGENPFYVAVDGFTASIYHRSYRDPIMVFHIKRIPELDLTDKDRANSIQAYLQKYMDYGIYLLPYKYQYEPLFIPLNMQGEPIGDPMSEYEIRKQFCTTPQASYETQQYKQDYESVNSLDI